MALARRKDAPVPALLKMLDSPSLDARYGACQALATLKGAAAPAVPALRQTLRPKTSGCASRPPTPWPPSAGRDVAVPELLQLLAQVDPQSDPRGMQQRYLSFALFDVWRAW